jgi:hypothetical protein
MFERPLPRIIENGDKSALYDLMSSKESAGILNVTLSEPLIFYPQRYNFLLAKNVSFDSFVDIMDLELTPDTKKMVAGILQSPQIMISVTILMSLIMIMYILNQNTGKPVSIVNTMEQDTEKPKECWANEKIVGLARLDSAIDVADPLIETLAAEMNEKGPDGLSDESIVLLVNAGKIPAYALEKTLGDFTRSVRVRRILVCESSKLLMNSAPS